jgi:hypothetical protein
LAGASSLGIAIVACVGNETAVSPAPDGGADAMNDTTVPEAGGADVATLDAAPP